MAATGGRVNTQGRIVMHIALLLVACLASDPAELVGRFTAKGIVEPSGLVASRRHPGIFWTHNDSGNPPALFAVRQDGTLVREYAVAAPNVDWEDVAIDDHGHIYLGDTGDNLHILPVHAILRVDEPDPAEPDPAKPLAATAFYFRYPEGKRFDAEALFVEGDRAFVIAKSDLGHEADLFTVPLDAATPLLKPATARRIGALAKLTRPATGASITPDGRYLAVIAIGEARIYRRDADGRFVHAAKLKAPRGQVEAIAWSGGDLILANEEREIYKIDEATWRAEVNAKGR